MSDQDTEDDLPGRLRALRVDPPAGLFAARLHEHLVAAGPPRRPGARAWVQALVGSRRLWLWPAGGVLAGAATFALLLATARPVHRGVATTGGERPEAVARGEVTPTFVVPAARVAVIKLAFAAEVDVADVTFEVTLPEGLAFWSRGQALPERSFRWPGRLAAGENLFPVAVRSERPGTYRVKATAHVAGATVENEIVLEVRGQNG